MLLCKVACPPTTRIRALSRGCRAARRRVDAAATGLRRMVTGQPTPRCPGTARALRLLMTRGPCGRGPAPGRLIPPLPCLSVASNFSPDSKGPACPPGDARQPPSWGGQSAGGHGGRGRMSGAGGQTSGLLVSVLAGGQDVRGNGPRGAAGPPVHALKV